MQILQWMQEGCGRQLKTLHYCLIWCAILCIKDINCHLFSHYYVKIEFSWPGNRLVSLCRTQSALGLPQDCFWICSVLLFCKFPLCLLFNIFNSFLPEALLMISRLILQQTCKWNESWILFSRFEFRCKRFSLYMPFRLIYISPKCWETLSESLVIFIVTHWH